MQVADLILPVFAVIVTGWLAGYLGYVARDLSDALIHFAYNVAMPAADCDDRARARAIPAGVPLSGCVRRRVLAVLRNRLCIVARFRRPRACGGSNARMGRLDDEPRLRGASSPPRDLRGSRGVARGDRDGVCRGGHVPRSGAHAGA